MDFMENMDWNLLRAQKSWLLNQASEHAFGLLHLLDAIQDEAVLGGIDESLVFGVSLDMSEGQGEPCPYASEIHNDYTPCQCGEEQRRQCAQDI